jgi:hypothetical protein
LPDLQDGHVAPGGDGHEVVGGVQIRQRGVGGGREVTADLEVEDRADPAGHLEAGPAIEEATERGLVGALEQIAVDVQAPAGEQDEGVVRRAQKGRAV